MLQLLLRNYGTLNLKYKTMKAKMQKGGRTIGRAISEKAATRKTLKDKGYIVRSEGSKGAYVPYSKEQKNSTSSPDNVAAAMSQSKTPRPIRKTGGSTKYQAGGMTKANTMNPTSRSTAMTALGVKKNNQYSPSKFDDNVTSYARGTGTKKMKTGGMVNSNSKVSAIKSAGSKGTKVGLNKRVAKPGKKC
jgi:hypothetical protein